MNSENKHKIEQIKRYVLDFFPKANKIEWKEEDDFKFCLKPFNNLDFVIRLKIENDEIIILEFFNNGSMFSCNIFNTDIHLHNITNYIAEILS